MALTPRTREKFQDWGLQTKGCQQRHQAGHVFWETWGENLWWIWSACVVGHPSCPVRLEWVEGLVGGIAAHGTLWEMYVIKSTCLA